MEGRVVALKNLFSNSAFGLVSLGTGVTPSLIHVSTPTLQWWALFLGVCIASVTLVLKLIELYNKVFKRK